MSTDFEKRLVSLRRDLHQRPEPAWREFYTTCRIVEELERVGYDELHLGRDALATDEREAVPHDAEVQEWYDRAAALGVDESVLERLAGGYTGCVAVLRRGEGPTMALRVDIDGLQREESADVDHVPAAEGFRSANEGMMHACGHDAHAAIGVGVFERIAESDFEGTLKVFFQPGEELGAGGKPMARSGHLDDVDYLLAVHVGLEHATGQVIPGISTFLAVSDVRADFYGTAAHAGGKPNAGDDAVKAVATAIGNLHAIPRHEQGATRINVGPIGGGTATNVVPERAFLEAEVRGETTELREYMEDNVERVIQNAAEMHDCEHDLSWGTRLPTAPSDPELEAIVADVARTTERVPSVEEYDDLGGSEDATFLMREVQSNGGFAAYVGVGTDHPGGHHTATFDVDEETIFVGVEVLVDAFRELSRREP